MKVIASGLALFLILMASAAGAFDRTSDDVTRFEDPSAVSGADEAAKCCRNLQGAAKETPFTVESSVTLGLQMRSSNRPFVGNYGNAGRGASFDVEVFGNPR